MRESIEHNASIIGRLSEEMTSFNLIQPRVFKNPIESETVERLETQAASSSSQQATASSPHRFLASFEPLRNPS